LRLPSALMGIAAIALLFAMASQTYGDAVALTAAGVVASSPMHIAYSQEARPYALLFLMVLLCVWAFERMMRSGSVAAQVCYVISAVAAMYTHTFAVFAIAAINLAYAFRWIVARRGGEPVAIRPQRWMILQLALPVLFWPWIGPTMEVARMGLPWMARPTPFIEAMAGLAGGYVALGVFGVPAVIVIGLGVRGRDERVLLPLLLCVVPVLAPIVYGVFTIRYGIAALLGLSLVAGYVTQTRSGPSRVRSGAGVAGGIVLVLLAGVNWMCTSHLGDAHYPGFTPKPDIRDAAAFVLSHARPSDAVDLHFSNLDQVVWEHYTRDHPLPAGADARWLITTAPLDGSPSTLRQVLARHEFGGVWVFEIEPSAPATVPSSPPVK
jgi:hypothetical protein